LVKRVRDLLLFFVTTALAAIHYLLKTMGTPLEVPTWLFLLMWILSMVMLLWLRMYGRESEDIVDYDEDLKRKDIPILIAAIAGVIIVASVVVTKKRRRSLTLFTKRKMQKKRGILGLAASLCRYDD